MVHTASVEVEWPGIFVPFPYALKDRKINLGNQGFYTIIGAWLDERGQPSEEGVLLYIGHSYDEPLRERIVRDFERRCINQFSGFDQEMSIIANIGYLGIHTPNEVSDQIYQDIECCLVHNNQPMCNPLCRKGYPVSQRTVTISNRGFYWMLKSNSYCLGQ